MAHEQRWLKRAREITIRKKDCRYKKGRRTQSSRALQYSGAVMAQGWEKVRQEWTKVRYGIRE